MCSEMLYKSENKIFRLCFVTLSQQISDDVVSAEKFKRLRERSFISNDNRVNIMVIKGSEKDFFNRIPSLDEESKKQLADYALEYAEMRAKHYPPQMQELIFTRNAADFIDNTVAVMVMDILYSHGTFRALTENEKVTSNLIMFADQLPEM